MKKFPLLLAAAFALCFSACGRTPSEPPAEDPPPEHTLSFLSAKGSFLVDEEGKTVALRGVNAGGLGVIETWMTGFAAESGAPNDGSPAADVRVRDSLTASKVLAARFGLERAEDLWYNYRSAWWTEEDFKNCAEMGFNVVRLPFTFMNVDFDAVQGLNHAGFRYDFTFLDEFVERAEKYGLYTILDLHGAYGSQNGQDHSGETIDRAEDVDFYSNEEKLLLTERLWGKIAEHFRDNPAVAGYDLLNEPGEKAGLTSERHFAAMDRFYDAIRAAGDEHVVIFESCWAGADIPLPREYGWKNCMYSFHHYTNCAGEGRAQEHNRSFLDRVNEVEGRHFGVPLFMGEFTCYDSEAQWNYTLDLLNSRGWSWTSWTYKVWGNMSWGVYNIGLGGERKVNVRNDSLEEIERKFESLSTAENGVLYSLDTGKTLFSVLQKYCKRGAAQ